MNSSETIQQASRSDTSEIAEFLSHAAFIHRHLDWQGVLDWIPFSPFLIYKKESKLVGLLTCPPNLEKIVWIRCFACDRIENLPYSWKALFHSICQIPELAGTSVYSVGLNDWFADMLTQSGFVNFQNIVVLYWNRHFPVMMQTNKPWMIRPMEPSDLMQVAELDRIAFEPIWVNPSDKISLAYDQSEHSSVVEMNGKIIGYEMTTSNHFSAHLARIAVHPDHQKQKIGSEMIVEMIHYFKRKGIDQISVNTQNSNTSSLALYQKMGFELSGESFPVFRYFIREK